jgi:uncharacterized protein (TIGR02118 family)
LILVEVFTQPEEIKMTAHLLIMYPMPKDTRAFDRAYREQHLPYAAPRLTGATSVVSKRVAGSGAPYYAISDVSFPTLDALQACAAAPSAKEALAHAASISTGGPPVILIVTDDLAA